MMNIPAVGPALFSLFSRWVRLGLLTACCALTPNAVGGILISTQELYVHDGNGLIAVLNQSSPGYSSTLDGDNLGDFSWTFPNRGANPLTNLYLLVFLDADLDRDDNTFFNEYGEFIALSLPPGAGAGAIAASGWEIDEPGFLFGNIVTNLMAGVLDNSNGVPPATPDDVSMAMLFSIGSLDPGLAVTLKMSISATNIDGLRQVDPDSQSEIYLNGFATVDVAPEVSAIPEPTTISLIIAAGFPMAALLRRRAHR